MWFIGPPLTKPQTSAAEGDSEAEEEREVEVTQETLTNFIWEARGNMIGTMERKGPLSW